MTRRQKLRHRKKLEAILVALLKKDGWVYNANQYGSYAYRLRSPDGKTEMATIWHGMSQDGVVLRDDSHRFEFSLGFFPWRFPRAKEEFARMQERLKDGDDSEITNFLERLSEKLDIS